MGTPPYGALSPWVLRCSVPVGTWVLIDALSPWVGTAVGTWAGTWVLIDALSPWVGTLSPWVGTIALHGDSMRNSAVLIDRQVRVSRLE